jgi:exosortase
MLRGLHFEANPKPPALARQFSIIHLMKNNLDNIAKDTDRPSQSPGAEVGLMAWPTQTVRFAASAAALAAAFLLPLIHLTRFSWNSLLFSYIPFVPFLSAYLIGLDRERLPRRTTCDWPAALVCAAAGLALLGIYWGTIHAAAQGQETQGLALTTGAFLLLLLAAAFFFYGAAFMRALAFPVIYCCFIVPLPDVVLDPVTDFMRTTSIWSAHAFLLLARIPNTINGTTLLLPNSSLEITPACSGFHAIVALVLTALFGGHLFLSSGWNRFWLALAAVPLGIVRNGFRIFVLSEMCAHQGEQAIDSLFHRQGGKLLFAISLIPLFLLLFILRKAEDRHPGHRAAAGVPGENTGFSGTSK